METRVAIISIIVEDGGKIEEINRLLHETNEYIIGRKGSALSVLQSMRHRIPSVPFPERSDVSVA